MAEQVHRASLHSGLDIVGSEGIYNFLLQISGYRLDFFIFKAGEISKEVSIGKPQVSYQESKAERRAAAAQPVPQDQDEERDQNP
jgi:hypothetical protein